MTRARSLRSTFAGSVKVHRAALVALLVLGCVQSRASLRATPQPATPRFEHVDTLHGVAVADPYRWLEASGAPEVRAWVARERALTRSVLDAAPLRSAIAARMAELSRIESRDLPVRAGDWYYWVWNDGTLDQSQLVRGRTPEFHSEVVLDPNGWSADGRLVQSGLAFSPRGSYVAFGVSEGGSDWRTWRVLDLTTLRELPDRVPWVRFNTPAWTRDELGFYYGGYPRADDPLRPASARMSLRYHALGEPHERDALVFDEPLHPERSFAPRVSEDGRWLMLSVFEGADVRNRLYFRDLTRADAGFTRAFDAFDAEYEPLANEGTTFWLRTTRDAPNGRIVAVDGATPGAPWTDVVAEGQGPILGAVRMGSHLIVERMVDVASRLERHPMRRATRTPASENGPVTSTSDPFADTAPELIAAELFARGGTATLAHGSASADELFFGYTDTLTPFEVWRLERGAESATRLAAPSVPFRSALYVTERGVATSADGTEVPLLITRARAQRRDGDAPVLLYGYGGFGVSVRPTFTPALATWLDMGGAYVTAHVRGGGEFGAAWHLAGIREHKPSGIEDFLAAAKALVEGQWTRPARLAIRGESNGGLLVGAALVRQPDLFGAALPIVGVLDMLRYHRLGIGWAWAADYGTADEATMFPVLRGYSPYHNVVPGTAYPPTLVTTAEGDDRVVPAHSYKFAAALRAANSSHAPVLLRIEESSGHGGARTNSRRLAATLDEWCFLTLALDLDPARVRAALRAAAPASVAGQ